MKRTWLLFLGMALAAMTVAQTRIPVGTVIPVELESTLDAGKAHPGQGIAAKVAQDVPLDNGMKIKAGSRVMGEVVEATPASGAATLAFRFDKVQMNGQAVPVRMSLRAIASPLEVESAQTDITGGDRGSSPAWAQTVNQIGGNDAVYREEGTLDSGDEVIGKAVYAGNWGAVAPVAASLDGPCRGAVAGNNSPQALWVFAHDACGVYGYTARIVHAGRDEPQGRIELASTEGPLKLHPGSALLLRVNGEPASSQEAAK
jgi:hypothetical protein